MLPKIYKNNTGKSAGKSHEKSFRTSHPLPRLGIHCSTILNTNHPIKVKHFHMLHTKSYYAPDETERTSAKTKCVQS